MVNTLVMQPMDWASLSDIDDVEPVGVDDTACLQELYAVLKRHGKHERFGVTLLHKHFPVNDDEVMLEHIDSANRRLELRPAKKDSPEVARSVQTSWRLTEAVGPQPNTACYIRCVRNIYGNHENGGHYWA
jgi:hypothetical protein